mmetsp:Transcript_41787/g.118288  ORF Transcript_41787/g.118288 Transcript_41787/m.118288 type:complete len:201 (-) Transcript_41787:802-1404(-)
MVTADMVVSPAFLTTYRRLCQRSNASMCLAPPCTRRGRLIDKKSDIKRAAVNSEACTTSSSQSGRTCQSLPKSPRSQRRRHPGGSNSAATRPMGWPRGGARSGLPTPSNRWPSTQRNNRANSEGVRPLRSLCTMSAPEAVKALRTPSDRCTTAMCNGVRCEGRLAAFGSAPAASSVSASSVRPCSAQWCNAAFLLCRLCW